MQAKMMDEGKDVRFESGTLSAVRKLWSTIYGGSAVVTLPRSEYVKLYIDFVPHLPGKSRSKIREQHNGGWPKVLVGSSLHKKILRLDVTVDNALRLKIGQRAQQLQRKLK